VAGAGRWPASADDLRLDAFDDVMEFAANWLIYPSGSLDGEALLPGTTICLSPGGGDAGSSRPWRV
jgi:hypothetical protein